MACFTGMPDRWISVLLVSWLSGSCLAVRHAPDPPYRDRPTGPASRTARRPACAWLCSARAREWAQMIVDATQNWEPGVRADADRGWHRATSSRRAAPSFSAWLLRFGCRRRARRGHHAVAGHVDRRFCRLVAGLGVFAEIKAGFLILWTYSQSHGVVGGPEDDPGHDEGVGDCGDSQHCLAAQLSPAAGLAGGVHCEAGKDAGEHDPDGAADHMHADDVEGVVVVEYVLQVDGAVAQQPGRGADDDRRPRLHVTRRWGDRRQPGDGTGGNAHA